MTRRKKLIGGLAVLVLIMIIGCLSFYHTVVKPETMIFQTKYKRPQADGTVIYGVINLREEMLELANFQGFDGAAMYDTIEVQKRYDVTVTSFRNPLRRGSPTEASLRMILTTELSSDQPPTPKRPDLGEPRREGQFLETHGLR